MRTYRVISADGHLEVPADMWTHRVPVKHRDKAPKIVIHDGHEWWQMLDKEILNIGNLRGGMLADQMTPEKLRYRNSEGHLRPGCGDAVQRLQEQDLEGIDAEVLFPPVYGPAFLRNLRSHDSNAYKSLIQAYNDFVSEEYCNVAPDRLIGTFILPETGVKDAIAEMERCRRKGLRAACLSMWPSGMETFCAEDDNWFSAALDMGVKVTAHGTFGKSPTNLGRSDRNSVTAHFGGNAGFGPCVAIGQLMLHGVFDRFPSLKIYFAETQCGWLPQAMTLTDDFYLRWYPYYEVELKKIPSDYYRDHCSFSLIHDPVGVQLRYLIGIDMMMWGTDLPHGVSDFPDSAENIDEMFAGVPDDEKHQILVENVCRFFDLDPTAVLTVTPQVGTPTTQLS